MNTINSVVNKDTHKVEMRKTDARAEDDVRVKKDNNSESADKVTLHAAGKSDAPFDAEKVASLKQSIENGTFKVDHNKIADKILETFRK